MLNVLTREQPRGFACESKKHVHELEEKAPNSFLMGGMAVAITDCATDVHGQRVLHCWDAANHLSQHLDVFAN